MTWSGKRFLAAMSLAGAFALGGCAYDDGYYGGMSVGSGYYAGGYYDDYWGPGYYSPGYYGGWYNGFYYPGSGFYVYDRRGYRHRWNDGQRRYWEGRRGQQGERWRDARGDHWRGSLARPEQRGSWQGRRWRDRDGAGAAVSPPVTRSEPRAGSPRGSWDGGRSNRSSDGATTRSDGTHWRGTLRR